MAAISCKLVLLLGSASVTIFDSLSFDVLLILIHFTVIDEMTEGRVVVDVQGVSGDSYPACGMEQYLRTLSHLVMLVWLTTTA